MAEETKSDPVSDSSDLIADESELSSKERIVNLKAQYDEIIEASFTTDWSKTNQVGLKFIYQNNNVPNEIKKNIWQVKLLFNVYHTSEITGEDIKWLEKLAEKDNSWALSSLGRIYFYRLNHEDKAYYYVNKSINQENPQGEKAFFNFWYDGDKLDKDKDLAIKMLKSSANKNYSAGLYFLGHEYQKGEIIEKNDEKALELMKKSIEYGSRSGENTLGWWYYTGTVVEKDFEKAFKLLSKSMEHGCIAGKCNLAVMYLNGDGVDKDCKKAEKMYLEVLNNNYLSISEYKVAAYNLGYINLYGLNRNVDYELALYYYRISAKQGFALAENDIGYMYHCGYGVERNLYMALNYYISAKNKGCENAANNFQILSNYLSWEYSNREE